MTVIRAIIRPPAVRVHKGIAADMNAVAPGPGVFVTFAGACYHERATTNVGPTTDQINHWCPDCGATWTTYPDRAQPSLVQMPRAVAESALSFIEGFEDDAQQKGLAPVLLGLRRALGRPGVAS